MLGLKHSAVQDDQEIVQKMPLGTEKMKRIENKLTLVKINFFMKNYKALLKKCTEIKCNGPSWFHFVQKYGQLHDQKEFLTIYMLQSFS